MLLEFQETTQTAQKVQYQESIKKKEYVFPLQSQISPLVFNYSISDQAFKEGFKEALHPNLSTFERNWRAVSKFLIYFAYILIQIISRISHNIFIMCFSH